MSTLAFNPSFTYAMQACRCAIYVWLLSPVIFTHRRMADHSQHAELIAACSIVLLVWLALFVALGRRCSQRLLLYLHLLEGLLLLLYARSCMPSLVGEMSVLLVVLAANTALWGWRRLGWFLAAAGTGFVLGEWLVAYPWQSSLWLDAWFVVGSMLFMLVICAVSHGQAQQLVGLSRHLRNQQLTLLRYLPSDLPMHLRQQQKLAIRQQWLTVVFVDLVGFTKASNELPPEALVELLSRFMAVVDEHVEAWGGYVSKFLGDGVLCVFPSEGSNNRCNAAAQAVRCVGLLPGVIDAFNGAWRRSGFGHPCAVRCGVASGYCCSGDWGGGGRLDYTVIGPPVNLAQRLQGAAADYGGILMDETTQRLANHESRRTPVETLNLKGLGSVPAYPLV